VLVFEKPEALQGDKLAEEIELDGFGPVEIVDLGDGTINIEGDITEDDRAGIQEILDVHVVDPLWTADPMERDWRAALMNYTNQARADLTNWDTLGPNQKDRRLQRTTRMLIRLCRFLLTRDDGHGGLGLSRPLVVGPTAP
jgi:hypothetical protein